MRLGFIPEQRKIALFLRFQKRNRRCKQMCAAPARRRFIYPVKTIAFSKTGKRFPA